MVVREQARIANYEQINNYLEKRLIEEEETAVMRDERIAQLEENLAKYTNMYESTAKKLDKTEKKLSDL